MPQTERQVLMVLLVRQEDWVVQEIQEHRGHQVLRVHPLLLALMVKQMVLLGLLEALEQLEILEHRVHRVLRVVTD